MFQRVVVHVSDVAASLGTPSVLARSGDNSASFASRRARQSTQNFHLGFLRRRSRETSTRSGGPGSTRAHPSNGRPGSVRSTPRATTACSPRPQRNSARRYQAASGPGHDRPLSIRVADLDAAGEKLPHARQHHPGQRGAGAERFAAFEPSDAPNDSHVQRQRRQRAARPPEGLAVALHGAGSQSMAAPEHLADVIQRKDLGVEPAGAWRDDEPDDGAVRRRGVDLLAAQKSPSPRITERDDAALGYVAVLRATSTMTVQPQALGPDALPDAGPSRNRQFDGPPPDGARRANVKDREQNSARSSSGSPTPSPTAGRAPSQSNGTAHVDERPAHELRHRARGPRGLHHRRRTSTPTTSCPAGASASSADHTIAGGPSSGTRGPARAAR